MRYSDPTGHWIDDVFHGDLGSWGGSGTLIAGGGTAALTYYYSDPRNAAQAQRAIESLAIDLVGLMPLPHNTAGDNLSELSLPTRLVFPLGPVQGAGQTLESYPVAQESGSLIFTTPLEADKTLSFAGPVTVGGKYRGPTAKDFNWEEIIGGHTPGGIRYQQSSKAGGKKDVFEGLTDQQIRARVQAAWENRELRKTQLSTQNGREVNRMIYEGIDPVSKQLIRMVFNKDTQIVESAWPVH